MKYSKQTYDKIGKNLALGMPQDLSVALATGKDKGAVNKYAYQICGRETVQAAYAFYCREFQKRAFVDKELLEATAAAEIWKAKGETELKPLEKLAYMKFIADINGHNAKDRGQAAKRSITLTNTLLNLTNKHKERNELT